MADQKSKRFSDMSRRTLMKMAGASLAGGYLTKNLLRGEAVAAESKDAPGPSSGSKAAYKYPHLLSPIKIGNYISRFFSKLVVESLIDFQCEVP